MRGCGSGLKNGKSGSRARSHQRERLESSCRWGAHGHRDRRGDRAKRGELTVHRRQGIRSPKERSNSWRQYMTFGLTCLRSYCRAMAFSIQPAAIPYSPVSLMSCGVPVWVAFIPRPGTTFFSPPLIPAPTTRHFTLKRVHEKADTNKENAGCSCHA